MRTTADVTMIPKPAAPAPTNDANSAVASTTAAPDASFKKTLEGAQTKQKGAPAKAAGKVATKAVTAKAVQKLPVDTKVPEETETVTAETAAEQTAAEETVAEETPLPQTPSPQTSSKDQPVAKTGKQKVIASKNVGAAKQEKPTQLALEKPREAKAKAARPAATKQSTDSSDTTETPPDNSNLAAVPVVVNPQTQTSPQPVEQDTELQQKAEDVTTKAVVPGTAAKAKSAAPAQADSDKPAAADFDDAMAAAEEILGPDDGSPAKPHGDDALTPTPTAIVPGQPMMATAAAKVHAPTPTTQPAPEVQFADTNHPKIVTEIHGKLLPNGGTMTIRLDPPELGQRSSDFPVRWRDGVMTMAFETSAMIIRRRVYSVIAWDS